MTNSKRRFFCFSSITWHSTNINTCWPLRCHSCALQEWHGTSAAVGTLNTDRWVTSGDERHSADSALTSGRWSLNTGVLSSVFPLQFQQGNTLDIDFPHANYRIPCECATAFLAKGILLWTKSHDAGDKISSYFFCFINVHIYFNIYCMYMYIYIVIYIEFPCII